MKAPGCLARLSGNQWICTPCGMTWDIDDNELPICKPNKLPTPAPAATAESVLSDAVEAIHGLLQFYGDMSDTNRQKMAAYVYAKGVQSRAREILK